MSALTGRYRGRLDRLMELSGERRVVHGRPMYGELVPMPGRTARFMAWFAVIIGTIAAVTWLLFGDENCIGVLSDANFAGTGDRFAERLQAEASERGVCQLGTVRRLLLFDYYYAAVYTAGLGILLTVWWNASWDAEPGFSRIPGVTFGLVAALNFLVEVAENTVTLIGLHEVDGGQLRLRYAGVVFTFGLVKWVLVVILIVAVLGITVTWSIRAVALAYRRLRGVHTIDQQPAVQEWKPNPGESTFGICLSGGGIRSAAFSLGALSALEETDVQNPKPGASAGLLGHADLLASVSGGGYAASAWRTAVGPAQTATTANSIIGNPNNYSSLPPLAESSLPPLAEGQSPSPSQDQDAGSATRRPNDLFPDLKDRRDYPRNGRGGMVASALIIIVQMAWHLGLLLGFIAAIAWPIGKLIGSWVITTPPQLSETGTESVEYGRLAIPTIGLLCIFGLIVACRAFTLKGKLRQILDRASLGVAAISGVLFTGMVVIPWIVIELLDAIDQLLPGGNTANSTVATILGGSIVASVLRMLRAPIQSRAQYLGGVLLMLGMIWFGATVALQASQSRGVFGLGWGRWLLAAIVLMAVLLLTNPDLWSLHWLYRRRLTESFANRWNEDTGRWEQLPAADQPPLSSYSGAPGPKQVICAVAARGERSNTGIPVVSMTFEPDFVTVHCGPDPKDRTSSLSHAVATKDYERLFEGRLWDKRYQTVFTAVALSAAAFAPSLGKHNLGTTNALIAALNLRLGVWMPNPMFTRGPRAAPDLFNMFKEIGGSFALDDANVYVTDGGHWENLALVELIRRQAKHVIAIDASGDKDYTFNALMEAVELAELECATAISFVGDGLEDMRPGKKAKPKQNWCRATITYPDGAVGRLLYIKAQTSAAMPLDVLRYSKEDPTFPNYSTADQLLNEAEFVNLAILGRESVIAALDDCRLWLFDPTGTAGIEQEPHTVDVDADIDIGVEIDAGIDVGVEIDAGIGIRPDGGPVAAPSVAASIEDGARSYTAGPLFTVEPPARRRAPKAGQPLG